jgi:hypothetical protein
LSAAAMSGMASASAPGRARHAAHLRDAGPVAQRRAPCLCEVMDALSTVDPAEVFMNAAQVSATEVGLKWRGHWIRERRAFAPVSSQQPRAPRPRYGLASIRRTEDINPGHHRPPRAAIPDDPYPRV